jgi:hypothetical protein
MNLSIQNVSKRYLFDFWGLRDFSHELGTTRWKILNLSIPIALKLVKHSWSTVRVGSSPIPFVQL